MKTFKKFITENDQIELKNVEKFFKEKFRNSIVKSSKEEGPFGDFIEVSVKNAKVDNTKIEFVVSCDIDSGEWVINLIKINGSSKKTPDTESFVDLDDLLEGIIYYI